MQHGMRIGLAADHLLEDFPGLFVEQWIQHDEHGDQFIATALDRRTRHHQQVEIVSGGYRRQLLRQDDGVFGTIRRHAQQLV